MNRARKTKIRITGLAVGGALVAALVAYAADSGVDEIGRPNKDVPDTTLLKKPIERRPVPFASPRPSGSPAPRASLPT